MRPIVALVCMCFVLLQVSGCSSLNPVPKDPDVKLVGLQLLPAKNPFDQHIAVDLLISNPNTRDLNIRGITYSVGIEGISLLSGLTNEVPVLSAMKETPVRLEVSADILQVLRLVEHFSREGMSDNVNYNFSAVIDFSAWLPSMRVDKKGAVPVSKIKERMAN